MTHILFGLQPTFILFAYLLSCAWRALKAVPGPRIAVAAIAMIVALAPAATLLWKGYKRTDWEYQNDIVAVRTDRANGIFAAGLEAQRITLTYIRAHRAGRSHLRGAVGIGVQFPRESIEPDTHRFDVVRGSGSVSMPVVTARGAAAEVRDLRLHLGRRRQAFQRLRRPDRSLHPIAVRDRIQHGRL